MKSLFSIDGRFFRIMGKVADLFVATLLFILGCLPVVTLVTSTAALYYTVVKCVRYDTGRLLTEFRDFYVANLRQGILLTLLFAAVGGLVGYADYRVVAGVMGGAKVPLVAAVGLMILSILFLLNLLWIAPVFSRFANTLGNVLRLNYVIALRSLRRTVAMLVMIAAAAMLILALNELIFLLPGLLALGQSFLAEPVLRRYMPEVADSSADWRYGYR